MKIQIRKKYKIIIKLTDRFVDPVFIKAGNYYVLSVSPFLHPKI